ncbi:MAG: hypothetical protein EXR02_08065 [Rhodospirillales bacterium]|nr:hypothetical protein [Rhodospirillales bacterium]MSP80998.1 hypothetical protein [Rhodospirillales bacterium]
MADKANYIYILRLETGTIPFDALDDAKKAGDSYILKGRTATIGQFVSGQAGIVPIMSWRFDSEVNTWVSSA